jgi:hypothetical protein
MPYSPPFPLQCPRCNPAPTGRAAAPSVAEPVIGHLVCRTFDGYAAVHDPFSGEIVVRAAPARRFPFASADLDPVLVFPGDPNWDSTIATSRENAMRMNHLRQLKVDQDAPSEDWIFRE